MQAPVGHRILGIDPGTQKAGWAVVDIDGDLVASGRLKISDSVETSDRIRRISLDLGELAGRFSASFVYCEAPIVHRNGRTTIALAKLAGAIDFAVHIASACKLSVNFLESGEVRKSIGVKGKGKPGAVAHIDKLLQKKGLPFAHFTEDEKEAIGVAWAGAAEVRAGL